MLTAVWRHTDLHGIAFQNAYLSIQAVVRFCSMCVLAIYQVETPARTYGCALGRTLPSIDSPIDCGVRLLAELTSHCVLPLEGFTPPIPVKTFSWLHGIWRSCGRRPRVPIVRRFFMLGAGEVISRVTSDGEVISRTLGKSFSSFMDM